MIFRLAFVSTTCGLCWQRACDEAAALAGSETALGSLAPTLALEAEVFASYVPLLGAMVASQFWFNDVEVEDPAASRASTIGAMALIKRKMGKSGEVLQRVRHRHTLLLGKWIRYLYLLRSLCSK